MGGMHGTNIRECILFRADRCRGLIVCFQMLASNACLVYFGPVGGGREEKNKKPLMEGGNLGYEKRTLDTLDTLN